MSLRSKAASLHVLLLQLDQSIIDCRWVSSAARRTVSGADWWWSSISRPAGAACTRRGAKRGRGAATKDTFRTSSDDDDGISPDGSLLPFAGRPPPVEALTRRATSRWLPPVPRPDDRMPTNVVVVPLPVTVSQSRNSRRAPKWPCIRISGNGAGFWATPSFQNWASRI